MTTDKKSVDARELAVEILLAMEREQTFSNRLIASALDKYDYLEGPKKAFVKRVTEGVTERRIELDYYLDGISSVPVHKMKPFIRCILRMSAYQILYMDSVPDRSVCDEACKLAGKRQFRNLKGFVNGVLRNLVRRKEHLPLPDEREEGTYLSVKYSQPGWLVEMWLGEYGREITETLLESLLRIHPVSVRFRTDLEEVKRESLVERMRERGVTAQKSVYLPYLYLLENLEGVSSLPGFAEGAFLVQDASSALAVEAMGLSGTEFVMDVCAAPGGKSLLACERAARVLARDVSEGKLARIRENGERMGARNLTVELYDAACTDQAYVEQADAVILDVPCSGLGVLGKKRDIKYHITPGRLEEITGLQRKIVAHSWQYVKPGGILLYSTCTVRREENEETVRWILDHFPFEPADITEYLPPELRKQREQVKELLAQCRGRGEDADERFGNACIQMLPGYMDTDGFFFAKLRRKG